MAAAERRRREDAQLDRVEREIERVWAHVAPPGAAGPLEELLLDRIDRLSLIDVDAPVGERPGIKQVKGAIRKGTYWYLRYMSDQLNALHNVHARAPAADGRTPHRGRGSGRPRPPGRVPDRRGATAEAAIGQILAPPSRRWPRSHGRRSLRHGRLRRCAPDGGVAVSGSMHDADAVLRGIDAGVDLRVGDAASELASFEAETLGAVVIAGGLQRGSVSTLLSLLDVAVAAVHPGGSVVVVPEDRTARTGVDAELLEGRSLSAAAWERAMIVAGLDVEMVAHDEAGVDTVVVARRP